MQDSLSCAGMDVCPGDLLETLPVPSPVNWLWLQPQQYLDSPVSLGKEVSPAQTCQAQSFRVQQLSLENGDDINKCMLVVCKTLRDNHESQVIWGMENTRRDHWVLSADFPVVKAVDRVGDHLGAEHSLACCRIPHS